MLLYLFLGLPGFPSVRRVASMDEMSRYLELDQTGNAGLHLLLPSDSLSLDAVGPLARFRNVAGAACVPLYHG